MFDKYKNIPSELTALNQWVVWRLEEKPGCKKPAKVPYSPLTLQRVDITNTKLITSYNKALEVLPTRNFAGIGFVFTPDDPYAGIDLDHTDDASIIEAHKKIIKTFDSYSETSYSGKGTHIIIKATVNGGRRKNCVELYDRNRYFVFTGDTINNTEIKERNQLANILFDELAGKIPASSNEDSRQLALMEKMTDEELVNKATNARNGQLFYQLLKGLWADKYKSQSEADFALINIISFYTKDKGQIARVFKSSMLGKRAKAERINYVVTMINKAVSDSADNLHRVEINTNRDNIKTVKEKHEEEIKDEKSPYTFPNGLVGEIAQFIYAQAPRPVTEIALAGALGLMSGICGRSYNVLGTGLNQYILLLAPTGSGKEAIASGVDALLAACSEIPAAQNFIGPAEIASGQALLKFIANSSKCFVSIVGEFGIRLQQLCSPKANPAELMLRRVLLDLYHKSGKNRSLGAAIYAHKENNTAIAISPSLTILGESTPENFYENLNDDIITDGLLPRFSIIEYKGKRKPLNFGHQLKLPSEELLINFKKLIVASLEMQFNNKVIDVTFSREAAQLNIDFEKEVDDKINSSDKEIIRHIWNRVCIKTLKIASVVAVGRNFNNPEIDVNTFNWAKSIILNETNAILEKIVQDGVGKNSDELRQSSETKRIIREYINYNLDDMIRHELLPKMKLDNVIPFSFIQRRLAGVAVFKRDKMGATFAIKRSLKLLCEAGILIEVTQTKMIKTYETSQRAFAIVRSQLK